MRAEGLDFCSVFEEYIYDLTVTVSGGNEQGGVPRFTLSIDVGASGDKEADHLGVFLAGGDDKRRVDGTEALVAVDISTESQPELSGTNVAVACGFVNAAYQKQRGSENEEHEHGGGCGDGEGKSRSFHFHYYQRFCSQTGRNRHHRICSFELDFTFTFINKNPYMLQPQYYHNQRFYFNSNDRQTG